MSIKRTVWIFIVLQLTVIGAVNTKVFARPCTEYIESQALTYGSIQLNLSRGGEAYDAYVRLGRSNQQGIATIAVRDQSLEECDVLGSVAASENSWSKIATIVPSGEVTDLNVGIDDTEAQFDASSPSLLLVAPGGCQDPNTCTTTFGGEEYSISPKKISTSFDTLKVYAQLPVKNDASVVTTYFYSDNDLLYTKHGPATLNKYYLESGEQVITKVLQLSDGTVLRRSELLSMPSGAVEYFSPKIMRNLGTIYLAISLFVLYILALLGLHLARRLYSKRKWRQQHVAGTMAATTVSSADAETRYRVYMREHSKKRDFKAVGFIIVIPTVCLAAFYLVNIYIIGQFTVNGISMETTFRDRSKKTLLKFPVTYAKVTQSRYVPDRGTVVVFEKKFTSIDELSFVPEEEFVVKRVLGLPGERVVINSTEIRVYPKGSTEWIVPDNNSSWSSVINTSTRRNVDIVLKENEIFVAGDNRENSVDSRDYGPIEVGQVVGRVLYKSTPGLVPYERPLVSQEVLE